MQDVPTVNSRSLAEPPWAVLSVRAVRSVPQGEKKRGPRVSTLIGADSAGRLYVAASALGRRLAQEALAAGAACRCPYQDQEREFVPFGWVTARLPEHAAGLERWMRRALESLKGPPK